MASQTSLVDARQLWKIHDDRNRYELVNGELRVMSPAGSQHGRIAMRIGSMLEQHVRARRLGQVFAAETGFLVTRNPDTVRAPDVAFVRSEALESIEDTTGYLPVAPDLVIEVISPSDSSTAVENKASAWLAYGCRAVMVVDPCLQSIRVYRDPKSIEVHPLSDQVDMTDIVKDWKFSVFSVFER